MPTTEKRLEDLEKDVGEIQEEETDIFKQSQQTINLLYDVLQDKLKKSTAPTQPTYITQTAPKKEESPNYILYIVGAFFLWYLLKGF